MRRIFRFKKRTHPRNPALRALLIGDGLIELATAMLAPIYALFVAKVGGDLLDAGLTGGVFALAAGITSLVGGRYADRTKNKRAMLSIGYVLNGVGFLLYLTAQSVIGLLIVQVFVGIVRQYFTPVYDTLYSEHLDKGRAGVEWSHWEAMFYFATAIGAVVGGAIASAAGFNGVFIVMACLCFVSAAYLWTLPKRVFGS